MAHSSVKKAYSRTILPLVLLASCLPSGAKSPALKAFIGKVEVSRVSFAYSFSAKSQGSTMTGSGLVEVQGEAFKLFGDGLEIWCDGKTRWTLDRDAEEAVVEDVADREAEVSSNPALLLTSVEEFFTEKSFGPGSFGGDAVDVSTLVPVSEDGPMRISALRLYFKKGGSLLSGASMAFLDGTSMDLTITDLKFARRSEEKGSFRFDEKTLEKSYVVTDLR